MHPSIHIKILQEIMDWAEHPSTTEVRLNFATGNMEVYDYESEIIHSKRSLAYFTTEM